MMKNFIVGAVIIGLFIVAGFLVGGKTVIEQYGAAAGPDHYNRQYFLDGSVQGGVITTLTATDTPQTITAVQVCDASILRWDSDGAVSTATLPTAASLITLCIPRLGDRKMFLYENYGDETTTIAVASTTKETLLEPSGGNVTVVGKGWAWVTLINRSATTVAFVFESLQDAD